MCVCGSPNGIQFCSVWNFYSSHHWFFQSTSFKNILEFFKFYIKHHFSVVNALLYHFSIKFGHLLLNEILLWHCVTHLTRNHSLLSDISVDPSPRPCDTFKGQKSNEIAHNRFSFLPATFCESITKFSLVK